MNNTWRIAGRSSLTGGLVLSLLLVSGMTARPASVTTIQGQTIEGSDIRAKSDGEIILTTPQGTRTFYKGQYTRAVADKPADFDRAKQLIEAGKYDEATKLLEDIVLRFRYLEWDSAALALMPQIYIRKGDYAGAVAAYEKLFAATPKSKEDADIQWAYRKALLDGKQYDKLSPLLNTVIGSGNRAEAARAQIMRGDLRMAQNQLEPAALDYLRTVVLFETEREAQPEALFKAADALEKLRDARAKDLYKKIVADFPNSPFAAQARAKQ